MPIFDLGPIGNIIWIILFIALIFFYPRLLMMQIMWKLEQTALMLENFTQKAKQTILKRITKTPTRELKEKVSNFLEFFAVEPISLDPYGILQKLSHLFTLAENRFKDFTKEIAPKMDTEERASLMSGLSDALVLNQISKIVRHFVELVRKTKNFQLALVLQMQIPFIERIAKAVLNGAEAATNGWPLGDSAGPLVAAHLIENSRGKELDETVVVRKKIHGRNVIVIKAKGPGGRIGKEWKVVENIIKREKIAKVVSIDAAGKLEGEKTGSTAEGVGVAMGIFHRAFIEEIATKKKVPIESVVIKMAPEEAWMNMPLDVVKAVPKAVELVKQNIKDTKQKGTIVVLGVGNTNGVGNNKKAALQAEKKAKEVAQIMKRREEEKPKRWFGF